MTRLRLWWVRRQAKALLVAHHDERHTPLAWHGVSGSGIGCPLCQNYACHWCVVAQSWAYEAAKARRRKLSEEARQHRTRLSLMEAAQQDHRRALTERLVAARNLYPEGRGQRPE